MNPMKAFVIDAGSPASCFPLTCTRALDRIPVANQPFADAQRDALERSGFDVTDRSPEGTCLFVAGDAWISPVALKLMTRRKAGCLCDETGAVLAWIGEHAECPPDVVTLPSDHGSFRIRYPWDFLRVNEALVGAIERDDRRGEVSPRATIEGFIRVGEGTRILPGVFIEGNVVIGRDCKIGPNSYIRGNTSIGDRCHIGQAVEIKNSIVMAGVGLGHLSYCGDSIVGEGTNFGAGTITSNYRHDGRTHRSMVSGELVDTGRLKFGAIIGDGVHTGIHTSIYPGRKLWPGVWTRPGAIVQKDLVQP